MTSDELNLHRTGDEPVFPVRVVHDSDNGSQYIGMSLRDYFAAQALNGLVRVNQSSYGAGEIAGLAYRFADAMLEARIR